MSRSLVRLAEPFFLKVLALVNQPGNCSPEELENLQRKLMADLQSIESRLLADQPTGSPDWEVGKRLLIYWADEVLTLRFPDWQDLVLEHRYFEEKNRAWKFFLEAEEGIPRSSGGLPELAYLSVVLGFEGDLEEAFRRLQRDLPGNSHDIAEARRAWTRQLQRLIQMDVVDGPEPKPLEGSAEPLAGETTFTIAIASFILSAILLIVTVVWWLSAADSTSTPPADAATSTPAASPAPPVSL
jgi:hypothetical protein